MKRNGNLAAVKSPSGLYLLGLVLAAAGMLVLPVIYLYLTALVCQGVYFFATHYFVEIWRWPVRGGYGLILLVLCSCTPILAGGAVAIAMVKPLFARRKSKMQPLAVDPQVEPRIYELAGRVCGIVGSPAPARIEVDCDVNASARLEGGFLGFFGTKLVLTLGMPLIAGLTERELAGVIAHEFGHFRQSAGMRLSRFIRRINFWFARVIYQRDAWDEFLGSFESSANHWIGIMFGVIRGSVGLARGVLWILMMIGHTLSGFLQRQMEYDADRAEIRVAGSAAFESTMLAIEALGRVFEDINREMVRMWRKQFQLPDNLPLLVEYRALKLPAEKRQKIENEVGLKKTGWLDTHPSPADRIRQARTLAEPGVIEGDTPARKLLENFDTISRLVTLAHYEDDLNVPTSPDFLIPLEKLVQAQMNPEKPKKPDPIPIPMMAYDPARFQKPAAGSEGDA